MSRKVKHMGFFCMAIVGCWTSRHRTFKCLPFGSKRHEIFSVDSTCIPWNARKGHIIASSFDADARRASLEKNDAVDAPRIFPTFRRPTLWTWIAHFLGSFWQFVCLDYNTCLLEQLLDNNQDLNALFGVVLS